MTKLDTLRLPQNLRGQPSAQIVRLQAWVTSGTQNPPLGVINPPYYFLRAHMHVTEAFNSDGTDNISIGHDDDNDGFATNVDVSSTGVKSVTLGTLEGYQNVARSIEAYYVNGGSSPTTGKAIVILEFLIPPISP